MLIRYRYRDVKETSDLNISLSNENEQNSLIIINTRYHS